MSGVHARPSPGWLRKTFRALRWAAGSVLRTLAALFGVLLAASFAGVLHPAGDSLAVFRLVLAACLALAALACAWPGRALSFSFAALAAASVMQFTVGAGPLGRGAQANTDPAPEITLYQKNLYVSAPDNAPLVADILAQAPDVVTLQEVSRANEAVLASLLDAYPHQVLCPFSHVGGVAVLSRLPVAAESAVCAPGSGMAGLRVVHASGPVWALSVHLHWPWPYAQGRQAERMRTAVAALEGPVVLGGDFNMVPWSHQMAAFERAAGGHLAAPSHPTLRKKKVIAVAIDHAIGPAGGSAELRPRFRSDHEGLLARLRLAP